MIRREYDGLLAKPSVYLAASFSRQEEMYRVARRLRFEGINVVSRWLDEDQSTGDADFLQTCALNDIQDVRAADVFVRFSDDLHFPLVPSRLATGARHFETGLAWALGKRIIVVGGHQNVFDWMDEFLHLPDEDALVKYFQERIN